ncbi:hypothetical protein HDV05_008713 [Chytridiales sp. JEL 0842]|nr:hypothetical protein HDV05_008713 [Chytridiales sp. JEL 0842]
MKSKPSLLQRLGPKPPSKSNNHNRNKSVSKQENSNQQLQRSPALSSSLKSKKVPKNVLKKAEEDAERFLSSLDLPVEDDDDDEEEEEEDFDDSSSIANEESAENKMIDDDEEEEEEDSENDDSGSIANEENAESRMVDDDEERDDQEQSDVGEDEEEDSKLEFSLEESEESEEQFDDSKQSPSQSSKYDNLVGKLPPELLEIVKADAPSFVKQISVLISKVKEAKDKLTPLLKSLDSDELKTSKGVSLLEVKLHSMLSYMANLSFFALMKIHGQPIEDHPSIDQLIELRVVLDKIKPLEGKLKYQIDKLVKIANDAENEDGDPVENLRKKFLVTDDDDVDKSTKKLTKDTSLGDPLQFRPNPMAFASNDADELQDGDGGLDNSGIYRPPRVAPVFLDDKKKPKEKGELSDRFKSRSQKSRIINDLRDVFDVRPEEVTAHGTGYSIRERKTNKKDEELDRITQMEEENYMRYTVTKERKKREKAVARSSGLSEIQNEISALEHDFASLRELDDAVAHDQANRFGHGVMAKRNKRFEEEFGDAGKNRKKPKYDHAGQLIADVSKIEGQKQKTAFDKERRRVMKPRHPRSKGNAQE